MRVEVHLTLEDFHALSRVAQRRAKRLPRRDANPCRRRSILGVCWLVLVFLGVVALRYSEGSIVTLLPFAVFLALTLSGLTLYFLHDAQRRLYPDEAGITLGPKSYELTDIGVVEVSPHVESTTRWSGIISVDETPTHLFLFVDRCAAFIIPKQSFSSSSEATEFASFAKERAGSAA